MAEELKVDKIQVIRNIANRITEQRQRDTDQWTPYEDIIKCYAEDETYEVNTDNIITGINIAIGDMQFTIGKTIERDIFEIYADDQATGESGAIALDTHGDLNNILKFLATQQINIQIYGCKLSSIGKFYKPNNKSNLNQLNNTDKESLIYLLEFLQRKGILELKENLNERNVYDRLADVLIEWNTLNI